LYALSLRPGRDFARNSALTAESMCAVRQFA
jgi:hypothetical protein